MFLCLAKVSTPLVVALSGIALVSILGACEGSGWGFKAKWLTTYACTTFQFDIL